MSNDVTPIAGATGIDLADGPVLLRGGTVYSASERFASAILLERAGIAWLGDEDGADVQLRIGAPRVVDLAGRLVTPAFVDAVGLGEQADEAALAAVGVVAVLAEAHDGGAGTLARPSRAAWARLVRSLAELDALPAGTLACLDPRELPEEVDLGAFATAGVPFALGSAQGSADNPWHRVQHALVRGLSARAAFLAHTRGAWRASALPEGPMLGRLQVGSPTTLVVWDAEELVSQVADEARSTWSHDARSGLPPLPLLGAPGQRDWTAPRSLLTIADGVVTHDVDSASDTPGRHAADLPA